MRMSASLSHGVSGSRGSWAKTASAWRSSSSGTSLHLPRACIPRKDECRQRLRRNCGGRLAGAVPGGPMPQYRSAAHRKLDHQTRRIAALAQTRVAEVINSPVMAEMARLVADQQAIKGALQAAAGTGPGLGWPRWLRCPPGSRSSRSRPFRRVVAVVDDHRLLSPLSAHRSPHRDGT